MLIRCFDGPHRAQDPERHRQIDPRTFFADVGGRQVDGYRLVRMSETGVDQRRFDPLGLSRTAVSGIPTVMKSRAFPPEYMSTSTSIRWASMPKQPHCEFGTGPCPRGSGRRAELLSHWSTTRGSLPSQRELQMNALVFLERRKDASHPSRRRPSPEACRRPRNR
jgi:hypothetical protein